MRVPTVAHLLLAVVLPLAACRPAVAAAPPPPTPDDVPTFAVRARVTSAAGQPPAGRTFTFALTHAERPVAAAGDAWSGWVAFGRPEAERALGTYPATHLKRYPLVTRLSVTGGADPTVVEAELRFDETGEVVPFRGELFGPRLGVLVWRDADRRPRAATMAGYNRRYWAELDGAGVRPEHRPRHFPIVERFVGGDDDAVAWREGVANLDRLGVTAMMLPPSRPVKRIADAAGVTRTAAAVYAPPGYAFQQQDPKDPADPKAKDPADLGAWARRQAEPFADAGWDARQMALFTLSDEPGWYYPATLDRAAGDPAMLARFRAYVTSKVGGPEWEPPAGAGGERGNQPPVGEWTPIGRSAARDAAARRQFYWSARFFPHDSARYFADATAALEAAFYPGVPVVTNWNFFAGRSYVPGPVANNKDKAHPDAAMGGHDWAEFARLRGGTMLWTEDWFPDAQAYQWSYYAARLRTAADRGGVRFGGYVIPRTAGDRPDGVLQKMLCLVGSGGKAVKFFVFGPEYNFPGNCYSDRPGLLPKIAEAVSVIGRAEDLLWPGVRPKPQVAILHPRSSQVWDLKEMPVAQGISDATNTNLTGRTVDYMAEVFGLYLALQHANVPADVVDEDDLSADGLKDYRVLYVTAPNVPAEGQRAVADWVRAGNTLVTTAGAAQRGRYDDPCPMLADATGVREQPRRPTPVPNLAALTAAGAGNRRRMVGPMKYTDEPFAAFGPRGVLAGTDGKPLGDKLPAHVTVDARFDDGGPALVIAEVGKGFALHFPWTPGLSYARSAAGTKDGLPAGFSAALRGLVRDAAGTTDGRPVRGPVDADAELVETPVLLSERGAAVTVLNWSGEPVEQLGLTIRVSFAVRSVRSVLAGDLRFEPAEGGGVRVTLPVRSADVVMVRP